MTKGNQMNLKALGIDFTKREDVRAFCSMATMYARTRNIDLALREGRFPNSYVLREKTADAPEVTVNPRVLLKMAFESVNRGQPVFVADGFNYSSQRELKAVVIVMARAIENDYAPLIKQGVATRPLQNIHARAQACAGDCGCGGGCGDDCKCQL